LDAALDELRGAGFRLDSIYPADDPHTAMLSRGGEIVRLTMRPGTAMPAGMPPFDPEFVLTRAGSEGGKGRAGMFYRDLIPSRLGGRYIASHITINEGGPVADWVHYHRVAIQVIAVRTGWVSVVYENQGEPFVMEAGDLVLQPAGIRHRVLESSPALEVVEISAPAIHETFAEHEMILPNGRGDPEQMFEGQRFLRHIAAQDGDIGLKEATGGLADAQMLRLSPGQAIDMPPHDGELVFGFVMTGSGGLEFGGNQALRPADAFVIPPGEPWCLRAGAGGLTMLHVTTAKLG
jgi:mannose-6-phosphate isomerase-like protein (cupin superfamily)